LSGATRRATDSLESLETFDEDGRARIAYGDSFHCTMHGFEVRFRQWEDATYYSAMPIDDDRELPDLVHRAQMQRWVAVR